MQLPRSDSRLVFVPLIAILCGCQMAERGGDAVGADEQPVRNSLGMRFVPVAGARALFCIHETRVSDYAAFARATRRKREKPDFFQMPDHPAVNVSWNDAAAFCEWLSEREKRRYRLPTDHEWSIAAGIGGQENPTLAPNVKPQIADEHPWGSGPLGRGCGNYCDERFGRKFGGSYEAEWLRGYDDGHSATAPVCSYPCGENGLHDLGGNVWEWCEDWYDPAKKTLKVVRGGAWRTGCDRRMLTTFRGPDPPSYQLDSIGFRIVLERDDPGLAWLAKD